MQFARALIESRPVLIRIPDQSLVVSGTGRGSDHIQVTRGDDGSYAFIYSASGQAFTVDLEKLSGEKLRASWYDPRRGTRDDRNREPAGPARVPTTFARARP